MRTRRARSATVAGNPASTAARMASVVLESGSRLRDSVGWGSVMPVILREPIRGLPWQSNPDNTDQPSAETLDETQARLKAGKGAPTPSRAQQEAARKRPLVPDDRKEAAKQARAKAAEARERARVGMAAGDERYLPDPRPRPAEEVRARLRRRALQHRRGPDPGHVRS